MLKRNLLLAGIVLQAIVLAGMVYSKAMPYWTGKTVLLRVVPVDPRDMFRGDYVALAYDFSRLPPEGIPELGKPDYRDRSKLRGQTVYVTLVPEEDGQHWRMSRISAKKPAEGLFIRGTISGYNTIQCGIESYYVQEYTGYDYEDAARNGRLSAEVAVAPDGQALLRDLKMEPSPTSSGPSYLGESETRWPDDATYRVRRLPEANITLDRRLDEPEWSKANAERHFISPWKETDPPPTEFMAFCDDANLYFAFRAKDPDIVVIENLADKLDIVLEDRVELFFSLDPQMKDYYQFEIDSLGPIYNSHTSFYRQFDRTWTYPGAEAVGVTFDKGYIVEGRIPWAEFEKLGFPKLEPGARIYCGLYRAEFSHDRSGNPVVQQESIHTSGRKSDGPPPIEEWITWIDPKTPTPDFHIPSSLGWLEIVP